MHQQVGQIRHAQAALLIALWCAAVGVLVFAQAGLIAFTLEMMTTHGYVSADKLKDPLYTGPRVQLMIRRNWPEREWVRGAALSGCFAVGLLSAAVLRVGLPHWRGWQRLLVVMGLPVAVGFAAVLVWWAAAEHLLSWGKEQIVAHTVANMAGGLLGLVLGRYLALLLVRVFVPPRYRSGGF